MVSDNGKTFKAAAKTIYAVVSHEDVQRYVCGIGVEWIRPHRWDGIFERMVRSTNDVSGKSLGKPDELLTAVMKVDMVINSRPLSYVPLTPSHLLVGQRVMSLPDHICYKKEMDNGAEVNPNLLNKRARHLKNILNRSWKRWRNEHSLELRENHRHNRGDPNASPILIGDIVVVHNEGQPHGLVTGCG